MNRTHTTPPAFGRDDRRFARIGAIALAAGALVAGSLTLGSASPALAHDELVGTSFVTDGADGSIEAIRLSFSNSIIEVGTEIVVTGSDEQSITDGAPRIDGPDVTQPLVADLAPGDYSGAWRVVSSDGHPIEGEFSFELTGNETAESLPAIVPGAPETDHDHGDAEHTDAEHDDAEHEEGGHDEDGHDSAEHSSTEHAADDQTNAVTTEGTTAGAPVWVAVAIAIGGIAVIIAVIAAMTVGRRRRAAAMGLEQGDAGQAGTDKSDDVDPR